MVEVRGLVRKNVRELRVTVTDLRESRTLKTHTVLFYTNISYDAAINIGAYIEVYFGLDLNLDTDINALRRKFKFEI